jgi:RHS repeat-associated protein
VVSYSYDAWGNFATKFFFKYGLANAKNPYTVTLGDTTYTAQDIDNLNGLFYKGYYYDKETKLYYLITRYYDPEVGRFISADDPK